MLLGRNGVGKTTRLKSLEGLLPIRSGAIHFNGHDINSATPYDRARTGIGRVIRMLANRGDMAILLVEQYDNFAQALADDCLVMARGQFIARGLGSQMQKNGVRELVAI